MQKKETIYIDVEDDITAIIGKIKASKEKIIALVPPKRVGVLQSAVNLRLLARTAGNSKKRLVVITHNAALSSLAASANIPVAKTLQSRPELAEVPAEIDDEDDVIDGDKVSIGDHAGMDEGDDTNDSDEPVSKISSHLDNIDIDGEATSVKKPIRKEATKKPRVKVPDFGSFRKKMTLGAIAGALLIAFFAWAIWIAPSATVIVSARTTDVELQTPLTVGEGLAADNAKKTLPSIVQTEKQEDTVEFTPTGKEEVGEKASGTVVFKNCESEDPASVTVSSGTYISAGDKNYIVQSTVVVPGGSASIPFGPCTIPGESAPVKVLAEEVGADYDQSSGVDFGVAGHNSNMTATTNDDIDGGSKKTITVVSTEDVLKAREQLAQDKTSEVKEILLKKFDSSVIVIKDSFSTQVGEQEIIPKLGEEVTGNKATITVEMVYTMSGIAEPVLREFLENAIKEQLGDLENKRIYDSGAKDARITDFELSSNKKKATISLAATGKIGPKIQDDDIRKIVKGKRYGEIEKELKAIDGVSGVKVNLSPFWVFTVPDDYKKITIEFNLVEDDA